jgi:hypothetical protein
MLCFNAHSTRRPRQPHCKRKKKEYANDKRLMKFYFVFLLFRQAELDKFHEDERELEDDLARRRAAAVIVNFHTHCQTIK